jgi:hypothetical protein
MSDLKPCPACGGKAVMFRANLHAWRVEHALGGEYCLTMGWESSPDEAANFWNSLPRREERREELMALLQMGAIGPQLRDEDRERMRFEAAVAAMQGLLASEWSVKPETVAGDAVAMADALLAELAKEKR